MKFIHIVTLSMVVSFLVVGVSAQTVEPSVSPTPTSAAKKEKDDPPRSGVAAAYIRPNARTRAKRYAESMFGPFAVARIVGGAAFSTWTDSPKEWKRSWNGFGRRVASNFGTSVIGNSVQFGMDEVLKVDSSCYRSQKRDMGSRIKNALLTTVTARRSDGRRVFGAPRIVGAYTSNIIAAEVWYPKRYGVGEGLKNGSITLGLNAAFNVVREFFLKK